MLRETNFKQAKNHFHHPKPLFRHRKRPFGHAWVGKWGKVVYLCFLKEC